MKSGTGDLKPAPPFFVKKSLQFENGHSKYASLYDKINTGCAFLADYRNGGFNYEVSDSCRRTR